MTITRAARPRAPSHEPSPVADSTGRATARISTTTASVRTASSRNCSIRIRRRLVLIVSFRYFIGAHSTSRNRRRLSRWMMTGTLASARPERRMGERKAIGYVVQH